jgi:hypothetical protein
MPTLEQHTHDVLLKEFRNPVDFPDDDDGLSPAQATGADTDSKAPGTPEGSPAAAAARLEQIVSDLRRKFDSVVARVKEMAGSDDLRLRVDGGYSLNKIRALLGEIEVETDDYKGYATRD